MYRFSLRSQLHPIIVAPVSPLFPPLLRSRSKYLPLFTPLSFIQDNLLAHPTPIYQQGLPFPDGTVILRAGTDSGSLMNVISVHQVIELDDLSDALPDLTLSSLSR